MARPEDFQGHSLSVSDIVVMNRDGGYDYSIYSDQSCEIS
ncbi:MAG: hypothetical protein J6K26_12890 [Lachnospiraceae bacterium]|nr:hypothetical protein [Lachnospiraceae bacterium]